MKKAIKLISCLLTFIMLSAIMAMPVSFAAETHVHDGIEYTAWTEREDLPTEAGNYYLKQDTISMSGWEVPKGVTNLCLNGHKLQGLQWRSVCVGDGATLNICNCDETAEHRFTKYTDKPWASDDENGTEIIKGGVLTQAISIESSNGVLTLNNVSLIGCGHGIHTEHFNSIGGAIYNKGGKCTLNNVAIKGCMSNQGGAICNMSGGNIIINGGEIKNSTVVYKSAYSNSGGAIYSSGSSLIINGTSISNCKVINESGEPYGSGGAIYANNTNITFNSGEITNCSAKNYGGIYLANGTLDMNGGGIFNNTDSADKKQLYNALGTVNLKNGLIIGNIYSSAKATLNAETEEYPMYSGQVSGTVGAIVTDTTSNISAPIKSGNTLWANVNNMIITIADDNTYIGINSPDTWLFKEYEKLTVLNEFADRIAVRKLEENDKIMLNIENLTTDNIPVTIYKAVYEANGELKYTEIEQANTNIAIPTENYKIFIWNEINPVINPITNVQ